MELNEGIVDMTCKKRCFFHEHSVAHSRTVRLYEIGGLGLPIPRRLAICEFSKAKFWKWTIKKLPWSAGSVFFKQENTQSRVFWGFFVSKQSTPNNLCKCTTKSNNILPPTAIVSKCSEQTSLTNKISASRTKCCFRTSPHISNTSTTKWKKSRPSCAHRSPTDSSALLIIWDLSPALHLIFRRQTWCWR